MNIVLSIITGPMWSGKTTELLRQYDRKTQASLNCILVKHGIDDRYSDNSEVVTHNNTYGLHNKAHALTYSTINDLINFLESVRIVGEEATNRSVHTVFIDEIQFFPDKDKCLDILDMDINVVVAGLNADYTRTMFPGMDKLFSSASDIKMLTAICGHCKILEAPFTYKVSDDGETIDVGGSDKYLPVCLQCRNKLLNGIS